MGSNNGAKNGANIVMGVVGKGRIIECGILTTKSRLFPAASGAQEAACILSAIRPVTLY